MSNYQISAKEQRISAALLFCISIVLLGICSVTTSPFFKNCYTEFNNNSSVAAQLIGKAFLSGKMPYKDLCGTEGFIYYLIQALGYLSGGRTGIYIIQVISLSATLFIIYRTARKLLNIKLSVIVILLALYASVATIGSGNSSMEFSLPFISLIALFLVDLALENEENKTNKNSNTKLFFLSGSVMAILLFLTFHNILLIVMLTFSLFFVSGKKNSVKNITAFCEGFCLISLPILIILAVTGSLTYFLYDGVLFHFEALKTGTSTMNEIIRKVIKGIPLLLICLAMIASKGDDILKKLKKNIFIISALLFFALLMGEGYWHYYICIIPFFTFGFVTNTKVKSRFIKVFQYLLFAGVVIILYITPIKNNLTAVITNCVSHAYEYNNLSATQWYEDFICKDTSVISVDVSPAFYIVNDCIPDYRLFANQTKLSKVSDRYRIEIQNEVNKSNHTYLLVGSTGLVSEIYGDYELVQMISLYRTTYLYHLHSQSELN